MTRAVLTALTVLASGLALSAGAAAAGPHLSSGGEVDFPHRSFVLSLPSGSQAGPADVRVSENGEPVHELEVTSAGSVPEGELGTVLVIDASNSMRGAPIRRAMAAARSFASYRRPSQALGVITFNRSPRTLLEPTADAARIESALAETPALGKQTRVHDGAMAGLELLQKAGIQVGSVVVVSDGADTGSQASVAEVADAAGERGVRVFTVGLESRHFNDATLARLAEATGGEYSAAPSAEDLGRIYDELGARLAGEYVVRYSSVAGPGKHVRVEATVEGLSGTATLNYKSPKITAPSLPPTEPAASGFWGSAAAMVIVAFGAAFLVCFGIASVALQRRRPETAEDRVAAFVAMGAAPRTPGDDEERDNLYGRLESSLNGRAWWRRFSLRVDVGRIGRSPVQIAVMTFTLTLLTAWLFVTISGAAWIIVFPLLIPWGVWKFVAYKANKQRQLFGDQLADNLQVIASAMRAGQSFAGALAVATEDAPEPAKKEFERMVSDEQLGVPLETSIGAVVERMDNRDLHQVALVAALQREAGGNSAEVLDRVADSIRASVALRRLVSTLTAQGRLARWVISFVPVGLVMFISLAEPGYLDPLFKTTFGNVMLVVAIGMGVTGSLVMKRIADIRV